jgi:hypothetical protein
MFHWRDTVTLSAKRTGILKPAILIASYRGIAISQVSSTASLNWHATSSTLGIYSS